MPVIFRGHGPLPQWVSDVRFCLVVTASAHKDREQDLSPKGTVFGFRPIR